MLPSLNDTMPEWFLARLGEGIAQTGIPLRGRKTARQSGRGTKSRPLAVPSLVRLQAPENTRRLILFAVLVVSATSGRRQGFWDFGGAASGRAVLWCAGEKPRACQMYDIYPLPRCTVAICVSVHTYILHTVCRLYMCACRKLTGTH